MTKYISIISIMILFSCGIGKKTTYKNTENYCFIVSFYSIGTGVDTRAIQSYKSFINEFETKNKTDIEFQMKHWGKEGETDFCFNLGGLKNELKSKFVAESKLNLKDVQHVHFKENEACRD